jgi:hypothetical protein
MAIGAITQPIRKEDFPWILHQEFRTNASHWLGMALHQDIQSKGDINHYFPNQGLGLDISCIPQQRENVWSSRREPANDG